MLLNYLLIALYNLKRHPVLYEVLSGWRRLLDGARRADVIRRHAIPKDPQWAHG